MKLFIVENILSVYIKQLILFYIQKCFNIVQYPNYSIFCSTYSFFSKVIFINCALDSLAQVSNGGVVDVEFLSCQNVHVSFAAVNMNGMSQFSPANEVCIFGGMIRI